MRSILVIFLLFPLLSFANDKKCDLAFADPAVVVAELLAARESLEASEDNSEAVHSAFVAELDEREKYIRQSIGNREFERLLKAVDSESPTMLENDSASENREISRTQMLKHWTWRVNQVKDTGGQIESIELFPNVEDFVIGQGANFRIGLSNKNQDGAPRKMLNEESGSGIYPVVSPDGQFVLSQEMSRVIIHNMNGEETGFLKQAKGSDHILSGSYAMAFDPTGTYLIRKGTKDGIIRVWSDIRKPVYKSYEGDESTGKYVSAQFTPDGKGLLITTDNRNVYLVDVETGKRSLVYDKEKTNTAIQAPRGMKANSMAMSVDKSTLYFISKITDELVEWDIASQSVKESESLVERKDSHIVEVDFDPSGRFFCMVFEDAELEDFNYLRVYDLKTGQKVYTAEENEINFTGVKTQFSSTGDYFMAFRGLELYVFKFGQTTEEVVQ